MSGTAVLESVGPIFLAQTLNREIGFQDCILVLFSAALAAMVTGSLPSGGIITMFITLDALKIPTEMISILMPVDWFLDRIRTPTNVFGNAVSAGIVSHLVKKRVVKQEKKEAERENQANWGLKENSSFEDTYRQLFLEKFTVDFQQHFPDEDEIVMRF